MGLEDNVLASNIDVSDQVHICLPLGKFKTDDQYFDHRELDAVHKDGWVIKALHGCLSISKFSGKIAHP